MFVVAGASGRTGRIVAETLLSQGERVRLVVRDQDKISELVSRGSEPWVASLDDASALARALDGAAGFYTLLPEDPSVPDFHGLRRRMVEAMANAVRESRVPHVVLLSAPAAMLAEGNGPAKDLHHAEQMLRAVAPRTTVIRASFFQENVFDALPAASSQGVYPNFLPSGDFPFPTVATRDAGRLAARLLTEPPAKSQIIDLAGPSYSVRDMAEKLGRALGKTLQVVNVAAPAQLEMLTSVGLSRQFAEALVEMFACFASGRISPQGDRSERGATTLDEVLRDRFGAPS